jgi:hypothetical protein
MPFDLSIWLTMCLAISLVGFLLYFTLPRNNPLSIFLWAIFSLLDQPVKFYFHHNLKRRIFFLGFWLIGAYFLGTLYKASMYSFLTSFLVPGVPSTLQGLIDFKIPIITTTYHTKKDLDNTIQTFSTLKKIVIPTLLIVLDKNYSLYTTLEKIQNSSIFVNTNFSLYQLSLNVSSRLPLNSSTAEKIIMPDTFAILDCDSDLRTSEKSIKLFPRFMPIANNEMSLFTLLIPWIVERNYFSVMLIDALAKIVESGIYHWWEKWYFDIHLITKIRNYKGHYNISREYAKIMFRDELKFSLAMDGDPVSFEKLHIPFVICFFFFVISLTVFCVECAYEKCIMQNEILVHDKNSRK